MLPRLARLRSWAVVLLTTHLAACGGGKRGSDAAQAPPLDAGAFARTWVVIDRLPSGRRIAAVTHGHAGYLAIGEEPPPGAKLVARREVLGTSADGVNWAERKIEPEGYYSSIAHGAGRYVLVGGVAPGGGEGLIVVSEDGTRTREVARTASPLRRVHHTPAGFVAVGMNGGVVFSPDGERWTPSAPVTGQMEDVTFGKGRFVVVGQFAVATSTDGRAWAPVACGPNLPCKTVTDPSGRSAAVLALHRAVFGGGTFLVTGAAGLLRSSDGTTWTRAGEGRDDRMAFDGGMFIELRTEPGDDLLEGPVTVSTSEDGLAWQTRTTALRGRTDDSCAAKRCLVFPSAILLVP